MAPSRAAVLMSRTRNRDCGSNRVCQLLQLAVPALELFSIVFWLQSTIKTRRLCVSAAPPLSQATIAPQPQRTTPSTTTTTAAHWGGANTTTTTGLKEGSRGAPKAPPVAPKTTTPPPLESFPLPERFCKATEERDIMWPQTPRGMPVERPCPKGTRGKQCSPSPQSTEPADYNMTGPFRENSSGVYRIHLTLALPRTFASLFI